MSKRKRKMATEDTEAYVSRLVDKAVKKKNKELFQLKGVETATGETVVTNDLTTNGSVIWCNQIAQGSGVYKRTDNSVNMESLRARIRVKFSFGHTDVTGHIYGNIVRLVAVQIKNPGASYPAFNDIFKVINQAGSKSDSLYANVELGKSTEFRVLRDEVWDLTPQIDNTSGIAGHATEHLYYKDWFIPLKGMKASWEADNTDGAYANMKENAIIIYARGELDQVKSKVYFSGVTRLRYTDN